MTEVTELRATLDLLDALKACVNKVYMLFFFFFFFVICYLVQLIVHSKNPSSTRRLATEGWSSKINIL